MSGGLSIKKARVILLTRMRNGTRIKTFSPGPIPRVRLNLFLLICIIILVSDRENEMSPGGTVRSSFKPSDNAKLYASPENVQSVAYR